MSKLLTTVRFPESPALFSTVGRKRNYDCLVFRYLYEVAAEVEKEIEVEIAHTLCINIGGYSKLLIAEQKRRKFC